MRTFGCYDQYAKHPKKLKSTQLPQYGDDLIMQRINLGLFLTILFAWVTVPSVSLAQEKPTLLPEDYGRWETLGTWALSPDGRWLAYEVLRVDEKRELRIRPLDRDTTHVVLWGDDPVFSPDSRWLAWSVGFSEEERERLEKQKKPVRLKAGLFDLRTEQERRFDDVRRLAFDDAGRFLALHGYAPEEPKGKGADLRLLDLGTGQQTNFGNVGEIAWSDDGSMLAMTVATGAAQGNGVQVYHAASERLRSLDASGSTYRHLAWREDAADLAVLRSVAPAGKDTTAQGLLAWWALDEEVPRRLELDPAAAGVPDTLEVVQHASPQWSNDGRQIAFGLRPVVQQEDSTDVAADSTGAAEEEELPSVQIWHTSDVRIFPMQKARESADERRTLLAVWDTERDHVVQIGTDLLETAQLLEGWRHGIEKVSAPYPWGAMFGRPYHDTWAVNLTTGTREKVLERVRYTWQSAGGHYLLTFDGEHYWSLDLRSGEQANLTAGLPAVFADTTYDTPTDLLPPHGVGGWFEEDTAVLLYDQFDVWRVAPDGTGGERLTHGAEEAVIHRVVNLDRDREAFDPEAPLYLRLRGEWSEKRGYGRVRPGQAPERLVFDDRHFRSLRRADSTEVYLYQAEARNDAPDLFVAGPDLASPRQVTATNPFMADYAWTRAELVAFTSETGRPLQAALLYPARHDPSRRYPMIVYTYELLSPQVHFWEGPSERDYYNFVTWTQQGYFVLLPDIVYRARDPGVSAIEAVRPAIGKVVEMGRVDPERVGLIGHSWGGYQATYLPTRTKLFAASVAGAPLTDFVSFMGQIHWNPGLPETGHWETGQGRMEVPYWEDPEAHHRNSPIHKIHEMETPLLMAFGDEDGVVDWDQGTEFYNFARRAGKQMVLLVYEGEGHGFRKKANQVDYHRRILEWFGHYLKGEPAPTWITKGISLPEQKQELRRVARQKGK